MYVFLISFLFAFLLPLNLEAATEPPLFTAGKSLLISSISLGNVYTMGTDVELTTPVAGDLLAVGGSVAASAPIEGDSLLIGETVNSHAKVAGDLRIIGGNVSIKDRVLGDLIALGWSINDSSHAHGSVFITAWNAAVLSGSAGPVRIYGNTVSLAGEFKNNVNIVSSGRIILEPNTIIHGKLVYTAPVPAVIPDSAAIDGGVIFTSASYLPNHGISRILDIVSIGFFLFVRILGALILAGLLAGLFPRLAEAVIAFPYTGNIREILLTMLLGFSILIATPVLFIILVFTFVGIGLALLILAGYALLVLLALMYAGILLGGIVVRRYAKRTNVLWYDGVFGMLLLSIIALTPVVGVLFVFLFMTFTAGALATLFFRYAFPHSS